MGKARRDPETGMTKQQEMFLRGYLVAITPAAGILAYKAAYSTTSKTEGWMRQEMQKLLDRPESILFLRKLRELSNASTAYSLDVCNRELDEAYLLCLEMKDPKGMIQAAMGKAKVNGLIIDKKIVESRSLKDLNHDDLARQLGEAEEELARAGAALAQARAVAQDKGGAGQGNASGKPSRLH